MNLKKQEAEVLRLAKELGLEHDYFFVTTFKRYQVQLHILEELEEVISKDDVLVTKEYVKGRENKYTNPAITDFNRTTDSANKTVSTLLKILKKSAEKESKDDYDPLMDVINGDEE